MIIAVDFDGILCTNAFPEIGEPDYEMISLVRQLIDRGHEVILWTSRVDDALTRAVEWCHDRGLHFCAVNENAPSNVERFKAKYPNGTRKVYADVYIDDHNLEYWCEENMPLGAGNGKGWTIKYLNNILSMREENHK